MCRQGIRSPKHPDVPSQACRTGGAEMAPPPMMCSTLGDIKVIALQVSTAVFSYCGVLRMMEAIWLGTS